MRRFGISRGHARHQLGGVGLARNNGAPSGFAYAQGLLAEDEGHAVFLPDAAVAGDAILIEDRPDIAAELNFVAGHPVGKRPSQQRTDRDYRKAGDS